MLATCGQPPLSSWERSFSLLGMKRPAKTSAYSLGLVAALSIMSEANTQTIETASAWNGFGVASWGPSHTPSFGQTFSTSRRDGVSFQSATFYARSISGSPSFFRALIYNWSGSAVTGSALFASPILTAPTGTSSYTSITVNMGGTRINAGESYVFVLSTLNAGNILTGPQGEYRLARTEGKFSGGRLIGTSLADLTQNWDFLPSADRDLSFVFVFHPDVVNTQLGLQSNSGAVRSVLGQRAAATTFALDYDCSVFDAHGFCVSFGFRNTQVGSNYADSGETAGLLIAAYRVTPEFRIGGFIDQNLVSQSPVGVDPKNTQPMLGAFAVYQENPDFSGLTIRAALAYQEGDLRITRPELDNTEPGAGRTRTSALAFGGEIAYGFPLDATWVAQPYAGLRRSDRQRRGYTETASDSVEFPITYNRFGQTVTSATAGLRLRGNITPQFSLTFGVGVEHDLDSKMDRYSGTSGISGLETFSIPASQQQNETRAAASAGMRYMIASNQALAFDASVRQMPYGNDPAITTMLRYSIGF